MKFLFTARLNWKGFYDNGIKPGEIDINSMIMLAYFRFWIGRPKECKIYKDHIYFGLKQLIRNLPYLGFSETNTKPISNRMTKLDNLGLITREYDPKNGYLHIRLTELALNCMDGYTSTPDLPYKEEVPEDQALDPRALRPHPPRPKSPRPPGPKARDPQALKPDYNINKEHINKDKKINKERENRLEEMVQQLCSFYPTKVREDETRKIIFKLDPSEDKFRLMIDGIEKLRQTTNSKNLKYVSKLPIWLLDKEYEKIEEIRANDNDGTFCNRCQNKTLPVADEFGLGFCSRHSKKRGGEDCGGFSPEM